MSKKISALILLGGLAGMMTSCTDEPLNAECDIEAVSLHFEEPERLMYHDYDTLQTVPSVVDSVSFLVRNYARIGSVPLTLRVTEGATPYLMSADGQWEVFRNGSSVDFSNEQVRRFRIVSQDKAWERFYKIVVLHDVPSEGDMSFDFEDYQLDPTNSEKFYVWSVKGNAVNVFTDGMWKNGNPGYKLSKSSAKPDEYPSVPLPGQGPDGSACLKLETCDTGPFGRMVNMRLASGSMFNGIFDVANALKDALKATQFGSPFKHKPVRLTAWLRFEPGETFQDKEANPVPGVVDEPDMYMVYYRNQDEQGNRVQLDGNDILSSPYIIGLARLPHHYNADGSDQLTNSPIHGVTNEWQEFTLDMKYTQEPDREIMENNGYSLVIGFASSWQGAYFQGAVGNKFYIDNVHVICDRNE